jgi:serine-type D-Ala-D-Ala carboxypeptidase/endopeptidase (penicillin-binding protein 4)
MRLTRSPLFICLLLCGLAATAQTPSAPTPNTAPPQATHPVYPTGSATPLGQQIAAILNDPSVARAHWGVAVTTLDGTPVYGLNEGQFFRPASNAKLYTTAAAMALLSPDTTVTTTVETYGSVGADGTLNGDLYLRGAGDANLSGRHIPYESPYERKARLAAETASGKATQKSDPLIVIDDLAAQIAAKGIKRINGRVIGDDSLWPSDHYAIGWGIDDQIWGFGAPITALTVDDNQIDLTVTPTKPSDHATAEVSPAVMLVPPHQQIDAVTVAADQPANIDIDLKDLRAETLHVRGTVAMGHPDDENVAVLDPATFAAYALHDRLFARGLNPGAAAPCTSEYLNSGQGFLSTVHQPVSNLTHPIQRSAQGCAPPCETICTPAVLASHVSQPLAEDVVVTLKVSQNLHAEMMLKRLGAAYGTEGTFAQGARVVRQWLLNAGLDGDDFVFYDGSGLSSHDLVTPRATAQLLAYATRQRWFAQWKAGLPIGGEDGSLTSRFPDAPLKDHVFAKTGTLGESRALSGYVDCASGNQLIFSVMVDNHTPTSAADRVTMDRIVAAIAAAN